MQISVQEIIHLMEVQFSLQLITVTNHDTLHAKRSITNQKNKKELV